MIELPFSPTDEQLLWCKQALARAYGDYTSHVSPDFMAMSLNAAAFIYWLAQETGARTAIDFGSGFTSYVLRLVCDEVVSVDDSPEWLAWTERFLERYDLKDGRTMLFEDYDADEFDLVVYDFSSGEIRNTHFVDAFAAIAPGGVAVLDDAMHLGHQNVMKHQARAFGYDIYGLQDYTMDDMNRFCALIHRP